MTFTPKHFRIGRVGWMMPCIMLALLALPSFGITTTTSRLLGSERPAEAEEHAERAPYNSQRRVQAPRALDHACIPRQHGRYEFQFSLAEIHPQPVIGHRLRNGNLAPMRC